MRAQDVRLLQAGDRPRLQRGVEHPGARSPVGQYTKHWDEKAGFRARSPSVYAWGVIT